MSKADSLSFLLRPRAGGEVPPIYKVAISASGASSASAIAVLPGDRGIDVYSLFTGHACHGAHPSSSAQLSSPRP